MKLYGIDDVRKGISGKSKPQQLQILKQEKINCGLSRSSEHLSGESVPYDEGFEEKVDELLLQIESDLSFKYSCDWNWFFNADNIPNQEMVFATKEFLESNRGSEDDSLFMLNVLFRQMDELKVCLDKPFDFVNKLLLLPITEIQQYTLLGLILKWHGGYPVNNLNIKYDTVLKLIEKEFLKKYHDDLTPEKEFCAIDIKTQKKLREAEAHVNTAINRQFSFTESRYYTKISIDFEDLPEYVIQRGIIWRFESARLNKDEEYIEWKDKFILFLETVPQSYVLKTLSKGIEYGQKVYNYHLHNECTNEKNCPLNQSWERRIAIALTMLDELQGSQNAEQTQNNRSSNSGSNATVSNIPVLPLSPYEKLWLEEVYTRTFNGVKFTFKDVWKKLHPKLPAEFHPEKMDDRLISSNGEEIYLLGVIAIRGDHSILPTIDQVIIAVRGIVLEDPEKSNISIEEIAKRSSVGIEYVSLALHLVRHYGIFYMSSGFDNDSSLFKSIGVGGADTIYYQYIQFPGIETLVALKSYKSYKQHGEDFSFAEQMAMGDKLDTILKDLESLKSGQEIIWTDLLNEINELKANLGLNKKNWKQLFMGKVVDMVASGVISETVSKQIVEAFKPVVGKLMG